MPVIKDIIIPLYQLIPKEWKIKIRNFIHKRLVCIIIVILLVLLCVLAYKKYAIKPFIKCVIKDDKLSFSTEGSYRSIHMRAYPQLLIVYDKNVLLLAHLQGYYENEVVSFDEDGSCEVIIQNRASVDNFAVNLKKEIIQKVIANDNLASIEELEKLLKMEVSSIGAVRYVKNDSNEEMDYCFLESNGLIKDIERDSQEISDRLYELELLVTDKKVVLENDKFEQIVLAISDEIHELRGDGSKSEEKGFFQVLR